MQEFFSRQTDSDVVTRLIEGATSVQDFIEQLLSNTADGLKDTALYIAIQQYYVGEGSPEIHQIKVAKPAFDPATREGSFELNFVVKRFYTCSALQNSATDKQAWTFRIEGGKVMFTGPMEYERDWE